MHKLLTIVIPVYNTEKYLRKCLNSLIVPEYMEQLEIIIVIDGSPDHSIEVAQEYEKKYPLSFRIIDKENGGHGSCCNVGLKEATGKYIRFLDSDDWFDVKDFPVFLSELSHIEADLVQTNQVKEYSYKHISLKEDNYTEVANQLWRADDFDYSNYRYFITLANSTFNTQNLRKSNIVFTEKAQFDDTILYIQPLKTIDIIYCLNLHIYHYLIGRPGQSVGVLDEKKIVYRRNEFTKVCNSYSDIRSLLSFAKVQYADRFINKVIINEHYDSCLRAPGNIGKKYLKEWHIYVKSLSYKDPAKIAWYNICNRYPYEVAKFLYYVKKIRRRVLYL